MLTLRAPQSGMSIIEVMIALVIMGILMALGLPSMATWLNNSQIRTAGETVLAGLTLARVEAVRRNQVVRFQLVSDLTSGCVLTQSGTSWVVSQDDPTGLCDQAPSDAVAPRIIQTRSGSEGTPRAVVTAATAGTVYFNGLGRVTSPGGALNMTQIAISNPTGGTCEYVDGGAMRCLRITISIGGEARMCDPAVSDATDPRKC
ncbi:MAG TPA: GspH/FimT family pseudopilin [Steroidobacteraceae bacterium]|nr:GspH/FimT family pseudopilin [Steroidobacteraceae bacterium]